ncbi:hypothetical protein CPLU01_04545 [Colletotrichum plurivorum]|uniref:Uncharacterized protein n=1 Tax=Colletotrichum plurivorum TaxID=2175906 RepID=A0A8H6NIP8_9PEZI|nr:hypothetical protein CPLU01_04545 [Colletotrichum plurivorum]
MVPLFCLLFSPRHPYLAQGHVPTPIVLSFASVWTLPPVRPRPHPSTSTAAEDRENRPGIKDNIQSLPDGVAAHYLSINHSFHTQRPVLTPTSLAAIGYQDQLLLYRRGLRRATSDRFHAQTGLAHSHCQNTRWLPLAPFHLSRPPAVVSKCVLASPSIVLSWARVPAGTYSKTLTATRRLSTSSSSPPDDAPEPQPPSSSSSKTAGAERLSKLALRLSIRI